MLAIPSMVVEGWWACKCELASGARRTERDPVGRALRKERKLNEARQKSGALLNTDAVVYGPKIVIRDLTWGDMWIGIITNLGVYTSLVLKNSFWRQFKLRAKTQNWRENDVTVALRAHVGCGSRDRRG